jgi:hypothetical protein
MKWTTLIPIRRNDGRPVSRAELRRIKVSIWDTFNGATFDGPVTGHWIDATDGRHYQDDSIRVTVVCENERLAEAEELVRQIGKRLGQKAMYFEVQYFDGVRFLRTDA